MAIALVLPALLLVSRSVAASPDLVLDSDSVSLSGTLHYRYVRLLNGSRITVTPFDGQPATSTGSLELIATDILIDATSEIDATGAGYRGKLDANGEGLAGGQGALVSTDAAGGGGHAGKGGDGVLLATCTAIPGALGGAALTGSNTSVTMGSAGSAAGSADGDSGGRGGNGGGAIVLRAGRIEISGKLRANGEPGMVVAEDSSGGGAGGGILLEASYLLSFGGQLSVRGAAGGTSADDEGGAGGGGRVLFLAPAIPSELQLEIQGGDATCAPAKGAVGAARLTPSSGCLDLDGDGFPSAACGGTDCDDSDASIHPTAAETCNGLDDDCSGIADDHGAAASCGAGVCVAGACAFDAGVPDSAEDSAVDGPGGDVATDSLLADGEDDADGAEPDAGATDASPSDGDAMQADGAASGDGSSIDGSAATAEVELRGGCQAGRGDAGLWWVGAVGIAFGRWRRRQVAARRTN